MYIYISIYVVANLAGSGVGSGPMGPEALKIKKYIYGNMLLLTYYSYIYIYMCIYLWPVWV